MESSQKLLLINELENMSKFILQYFEITTIIGNTHQSFILDSVVSDYICPIVKLVNGKSSTDIPKRMKKWQR